MNRHQINNIFYYLGIMKYDSKILNISPDYLIEKSSVFFNSLGNDYFVENNLTENIWIDYCKLWGVNKKNYAILNIINFILMSNLTNSQNVIKNYKMYIGNIENINDCDLHYKVHPILLGHINYAISNDRYLKLLSLQ